MQKLRMQTHTEFFSLSKKLAKRRVFWYNEWEEARDRKVSG